MSIYKNSMGRHYLRGLFYETNNEDQSSTLYTLKKQDHNGFKSLYRLFLSEADPTEYRFAVKYLDGWGHWMALTKASWFQEYLLDWRDELNTKLRSTALAAIVSVSQDQANPASYHANKYLLEALEKPAGALKRGRPSKDEVQAELKRQAASLKEIDNDMERIGIQ